MTTATPHYADDTVTLWHGDCLDVLRTLPDASVDSVVTDPPYGIGFMGKEWDSGKSFVERKPAKRNTFDHVGGNHNPSNSADAARTRRVESAKFGKWCELWATECLRVLKPGGHLLAFGGTRTWHRLACAVEDAGFEVRDSIAWLMGSGFPKSHNVRKALGDRACQCEKVESEHGANGVEQEPGTGLPGVRGRVSPLADEAQRTTTASVQPSVSREARRGPAGSDGREHEGPEAHRSEVRGGQPGMEGRRDLQAPEGELRGSALREVPTGVPGDGEVGRLHHGAPSRDGSQVGALSAAVGSGEPHQPRPAGQSAGESGVVPVERGSQARGGWAVCGRCGKPSVPDGLGTALKPAFEPVVVARKPLIGTVAATVLAHGTGALNIDGCRIGTTDILTGSGSPPLKYGGANHRPFHDAAEARGVNQNPAGRWPANVVLDESQAEALDEQSGTLSSGKMRAGTKPKGDRETYGKDAAGGYETSADTPGDMGGASRFFYVAKADATERPRINGTAHPTVKPLTLMRWLVKLVTPPGGTVLEPFAGSGTTVEACILEGFHCIAIEKTAEYLPLITQRVNRRRDPVEAIRQTGGDLGLFDLFTTSNGKG